MVLSFLTRPNFFVGEISVEGAPNPPAANQIVNASKLQLGELFTREKLERALVNIKQLMEQNGYYQSSASDEEQAHPETQQMNILFRITLRTPRKNWPRDCDRPGWVFSGTDSGHRQDASRGLRHRAARQPCARSAAKEISEAESPSVPGRHRRVEPIVPKPTLWTTPSTIDPGPKVEIAAEGFKISHSQLKKNVPVYEENALDDDLLNEGRRNLLNYMQSRGYFDAKVSSAENLNFSRRAAGCLHHQRRTTATSWSSWRLQATSFSPRNRFARACRCRPLNASFPMAVTARRCLARMSATSSPTHTTPTAFSKSKITPKVEDNYRGNKNELAITLQIDEGPQTMVGSIKIAGNEPPLNTPFPDLNLSPGQPFGYSKINEDREIVLNYYFNNGFPNATFEASAKPSQNDPHLMDVTYTVHPGDQVIVDQVYVAGTVHTRDSIVQREIQIKPGDPLSQIDMLNTQKKLYDLGIFSQVDTAVQNPGSSEPEKNVLVNVQEAKRYTFNYGLGLEFQTGQPVAGSNTKPLGETGVSPRVSFGVTRLNFRGLNHTVTFKGNVGRLQQRGLVSYDAPRLFNNPNWRLTFTAFYDNTVDVTTFTSQRLEGSVAGGADHQQDQHHDLPPDLSPSQGQRHHQHDQPGPDSAALPAHAGRHSQLQLHPQQTRQ